MDGKKQKNPSAPHPWPSEAIKLARFFWIRFLVRKKMVDRSRIQGYGNFNPPEEPAAAAGAGGAGAARRTAAARPVGPAGTHTRCAGVWRQDSTPRRLHWKQPMQIGSRRNGSVRRPPGPLGACHVSEVCGHCCLSLPCPQHLAQVQCRQAAQPCLEAGGGRVALCRSDAHASQEGLRNGVGWGCSWRKYWWPAIADGRRIEAPADLGSRVLGCVVQRLRRSPVGF